MKNIYRCVKIGREWTEDTFEDGCIGGEDDETGLFHEEPSIEADTLQGLIDAIARHLADKHNGVFIIDEVTLPAEGVDRKNLTEILFYRQETINGQPPTEANTEAWKRGQDQQFYARYCFTVEHIHVIPITLGELRSVVGVDWP